MPDDRTDPPDVADERPMLEAWLEWQRATLAWKCDGVPGERLAERTVPPSPMSLLGLVRHMAEVERSWFRRMLGSEEAPPIYYTDDNPDGDFLDVDGADPDEAFATWRGECDRAREIAAGLELDDVGTRHGREVSLRWVLLHMIEEYARHNGHADLIRERLDGVVGD